MIIFTVITSILQQKNSGESILTILRTQALGKRDMAKNIVLIGIMGSGKTTLGKIIAEKTGMEFIDTDEMVIQRVGKQIGEIFEEHGEAYFRDIEAEIVEEVSKKENCVISTGGGVVLRDENVDSLKRTGVMFFLTASPMTLWERVKGDKLRPLLKGDNVIGVLKRVLTARLPLYEQADYTINTENSPEKTV